MAALTQDPSGLDADPGPSASLALRPASHARTACRSSPLTSPAPAVPRAAVPSPRLAHPLHRPPRRPRAHVHRVLRRALALQRALLHTLHALAPPADAHRHQLDTQRPVRAPDHQRLCLATALPAPLPNALGSLLQIVPFFTCAVNWSGGSASAAGDKDPEAREQRKPAHQHGYLHRCVNRPGRAAIMRMGMGNSRIAMGQEALLTDDAAVLQGAFARLAERYPDDALRIRVVYGAADGMTPAKRRAWIKGQLEAAGLICADDVEAWTEVSEAGHDDVLFLEEVVAEILERME
ncbi:hypothetical protein FB451DRAFT_1231553 [Mycena latifolia]|nr:hypothetical protein FB451DRAFT_1231553 [Mycena latifolia]